MACKSPAFALLMAAAHVASPYSHTPNRMYTHGMHRGRGSPRNPTRVAGLATWSLQLWEQRFLSSTLCCTPSWLLPLLQESDEHPLLIYLTGIACMAMCCSMYMYHSNSVADGVHLTTACFT